MASMFQKFRALYGVYAQDWLAYKANGVIWILTDLVTAITMPLVWANVAKTGTVAGYDSASFVVYYLAMLGLGSFITSHLMWEIGFEIKEGVFTTNLIRPVSFFLTFFTRNFAWRTIRFVFTLPFLLGLGFAYSHWLGGAKLYLGPEFWICTLLGHGVSIAFVIAFAAIALWVEEAFTIFELHYVPQIFLSGYMFPVDVMPDWVRMIAQALPFYYTTGVPVELLVGKIPPSQAPTMMLIQVAWITASCIAARYLWQKGLRQYGGVGI